MKPILSLENVTVTAGDREILRSVELQVMEGEKVSITGASGSGKSTLLQTIVGVHPLRSGMIAFAGTTVSPLTVSSMRQQVAFIGQEPILGADIVYDALVLPFSFRAHKGRTPTRKVIVDTLERLGLQEKILSQSTSSISGGEKQRIAIARALLLDKTFFLADEITSALDHDSTSRIRLLLNEPQYSVVAVTHDPDLLSGTVYEISNGNIAPKGCRP